MPKRTDYAVLALIVLNYALEAALLTHVDGFALPPVAIYVIAVALAPIAPLLAVLPSFGVRVPSFSPLVTLETTATPEAPALESAAALHAAP